MRKLSILIIFLMIFSSYSIIAVTGSSSGDDEDANPPAGGGGGGGSPQFFDYYVPLIFDETHSDGVSEVSVWIAIPTVLITSFAQNDLGSNFVQVREPTVITFNPEDNNGLTNGSLIRTTAPVQVVGQRVTEDIAEDNSFAYSILPRRMMGFEYDSPFNGKISLFTLNPNTQIQITNPDGSYTSDIIEVGGTGVTLDVAKGAYINSSFPTIGAFYSKSEGTSASMAVPRYMQGDTYYFSGDLTAPNENEIDRSYFRVNPSQPTEITIMFEDGTTSSMNIYGVTDFVLDPSIRGITSSRGRVEVNIRSSFDYGGNERVSTLQLFSINEMRSAEIFLTPTGFTTYFSAGVSEIDYNVTSYRPSQGSYENENRMLGSMSESDVLAINGVGEIQYFSATDYLFSYSMSPGKISHPMAPSVAFLNLPLNGASRNNISGLAGTWYRIPNIAVMRIDIIPGPVEEYTGQLIQIEVKANGTLPASQFRVEVIIDQEIEIDETYDFLQVNDSIIYDIRIFLPIGQDSLNISIEIDVDDQISEFNEDDNFREVGYNVQNNIRLRFTIAVIFIGLLVFGIYKLRKWLKQRQNVTRAHVDAILTFEEEE